MKTERYEHHKHEVVVQSHLKGKHREHCLCYGCGRFFPEDPDAQCPTAEAVYQNCKKYAIVTPVWECPRFISKSGG